MGRDAFSEEVIAYVTRLLTEPSTDWFMDDFGDRKRRRKQNVVKFCYQYNRKRRYNERNEMNLDKLQQQTCAFSDGQEIEMYDETNDQWNIFIIKKHLSNSQFLLYDKQRKLHTFMDLKSLLQV